MSERVTKTFHQNTFKSLKIPKPTRRRTDNIMTKKKGQTAIYKIIHRKIKIEQHETHFKPGVNTDTPEW